MRDGRAALELHRAGRRGSRRHRAGGDGVGGFELVLGSGRRVAC